MRVRAWRLANRRVTPARRRRNVGREAIRVGTGPCLARATRAAHPADPGDGPVPRGRLGPGKVKNIQWFQYKDDLLDERIWKAYLTAVPFTLSYPVTRAWWDFVKYDYFDDEFVEELDEYLSETPVFDDLRPTIEMALEAAGR